MPAESECIPGEATASAAAPAIAAPATMIAMPDDVGLAGAPEEGDGDSEHDMEHSLLQEKRMRDFFAADAASLAADSATAAAAAAAARAMIETEREDENPRPDLAVPVPYKCTYRVFRINPKPYYAAECLEARLPMLGAESVDQLCKTIIMENTKHMGKRHAARRYWILFARSRVIMPFRPVSSLSCVYIH